MTFFLLSSGRQRAVRKLTLSAAVFPLFRLWTKLLESMRYFRDEVKAVDQVSTAKSRECPKSVRFSHSATLLQIVELHGALSQNGASLGLWQLFGNLGRGAREKPVR